MRQKLSSFLKRSSSATRFVALVRQRLQPLRRIADSLSPNGRQRRAWRDVSQPFAFAEGREKFVVRSNDGVIGKRLFLTGQFDFDKFELALSLLGRSQLGVLVDVGANVGSICIPAVARGLAERALAFEPEPINYALLVTNCRWNGVEARLQTFPCALSSSDEVLSLSYPSPGNFGDVRVEGLPVGEIGVQGRRFDGLGVDLDAGRDLIWMDVQGHELEALTGMGDALSLRVPLVMEFWPHVLREHGSVDRLLALLGGYSRFLDLKYPDAGWQSMPHLRELWLSYESKDKYTDIVVR